MELDMRKCARIIRALLVGAFFHMDSLVNASCECGYSVVNTTEGSHTVYTDLVENDFLHSSTSNLTELGWRPQSYNMSAKAARGPYGKAFQVDNALTNPLKDVHSWSGASEQGGDAGLQLWVRGDHSHGYVSGAELAHVRDDMRFGSFRVSMKLGGQNGTCGAFFWFLDDSSEIDLEFLSKQFRQSRGMVNFVLQSPESVSSGYDAVNTSSYKAQTLNFRPDEGFHEYRFDWTEESVLLYIDGQQKWIMRENVPRSGGRLFLNHWSNGDPLWSSGPPLHDTVMTINYVKAYFNSTNVDREVIYRKGCPQHDANLVCQIPDGNQAPGTVQGQTYFFTQDPGHTPGQEVSSLMSGATAMAAVGTTYAPVSISLLIMIFLSYRFS